MYGVQRVFLIIFYLISALTLFWLLFHVLHDLLELSGAVIIPFALVYLILVVLLYSFIQVITYIPANLPGAFDPIKNDIAERKVSSGQELAARLAAFMVDFFSFAFFDIECAIVRIGEDESSFPEGFLTIGEIPDPAQLEAKSREGDVTSCVGRISSGGRQYHMYIIPLVFGDEWLGYIAILSQRRLWRVFMHLLAEFENDFIDDQVVHVLGMNPA
jgi:hypothetical protein